MNDQILKKLSKATVLIQALNFTLLTSENKEKILNSYNSLVHEVAKVGQDLSAKYDFQRAEK